MVNKIIQFDIKLALVHTPVKIMPCSGKHLKLINYSWDFKQAICLYHLTKQAIRLIPKAATKKSLFADVEETDHRTNNKSLIKDAEN